MKKLKVKIKKLHPNAVIPKYAKLGDAGLDLTATSKEDLDNKVKYGTGLAFEIPEGHVGLVFPRSSISKMSVRLTNCVGVIDSKYRGEIMAIFDKDQGAFGPEYEIGDRICQIIILPYPIVDLEETEELSSTDRADGGFGSTGL